MLIVIVFIAMAITIFVSGTKFAVVLFSLETICMLAAGICFAKDDADGKVHERELTVSEVFTDKHGNRMVRLWARKAIHLPLIPVKVIHVDFPSIVAYDTVMAYGEQKFLAHYVRKRKGVVVTDEYLDIRPLESKYPR